MPVTDASATPTEQPSQPAQAEGRFGPIAGLAASACIFASFVLSGEVGSEPTDSSSAVVDAFLDPENDVESAAIVAMLGAGLLLVFGAHQRNRMRSRGATWTADALVLGLVAIASATMIDTGIDLMGRVGAEHGHQAVAVAANDFGWNITWLYTPGLLAIGLAGATAGLQGRGLPRWLGGTAVVVTLGAMMPWIGLAVLLLWLTALSIRELRAGRADHA